LRCSPSIPESAKHDLVLNLRASEIGRSVTVPHINGKTLYEVGLRLFMRGLRVRFSPELKKEWKPGGLGCRRQNFEAILMNTVLCGSPLIKIEPPPGTAVQSGDSVTLYPY
jgi:hypothetical protein